MPKSISTVKCYGTIKSTKCVILGPSAYFEGNIECESALVCGRIEGSIVAKRLIEVKRPAVVMGDLMSALVRVDTGVILQGKVLSRPEEQKGLLSAVMVDDTVDVGIPES